ncbi:MAG: hypothetical protein IKZ28_01810 [Clostridia bacterium]|nr:hypothetical protein [Clostridia bacterium]
MSNVSKMKKEVEREKLIAGTIVDIQTQREAIEKIAADYFNYAVEAAEMGQDEYATELLETSAEMEDFAENLKFLELKIKTAAITAKTLGNLRTLPDALKACRNIFSKGPNFKKLGKDMGALMESLGTARDQFREFRKSLGKSKDAVYSEVFGKDATDPKLAAKVEEKKKALTAALMQRQKSVAPAPAAATESAAATDGATQAAAAKVDAIAALLDEEKKRKP